MWYKINSSYFIIELIIEQQMIAICLTILCSPINPLIIIFRKYRPQFTNILPAWVEIFACPPDSFRFSSGYIQLQKNGWWRNPIK